MNISRTPWRALLAAAALAGALPLASLAQTAEPKPETVRPEIAKPVIAADELIAAKKFQDALAKLREADAVADLTPYETFVIDRTRAVAAAGAGDQPLTIKSLEAVVASGRAVPADQLKMIEALALANFNLPDYPKSASWASRYLSTGGTDPRVRLLRVRALYLANDYAPAATELRAMVDADEKAGVAPPFDWLQLLASIYLKLNDTAGSLFVSDRLLVHYPRKEYWADAIRRAQAKPGYSDALQLDVLRLQDATGNLSSAAQYTAMAQLALKATFPGEAKRVLDQGYAAGVLGAGADADLQRRLRETATKQVAEDERTFAQNARDAAAAKDGTALVTVGYAMVTAGQFEKGLALMEQGIQKGGISRLDEAKLHLAIAYLAAGQKAKAVDTFRGVQGTDATAELARLWLIHAQRSTS